MRKIATLGLILLAVSATGGCKAVSKVIGKAATEAMSGSDEAMGAYVEGYNALINRPTDAVNEYRKRIPESGPPVNKKVNFVLMGGMIQSDLETAKKAFERARGSASDEMGELGPAADAALASMTQLVSVVTDMDKYYDAEDFKDDGGAKAKKLHETFVAQYKVYRENIDKLDRGLEAIQTKAMAAELAKYDDKKSPSYLYRKFNFEANRLMKKREATEITTQFDEIDKLFSEIEGVAKTEAAGNLKGAFESYRGTAARFHTSAKKLNRAAADPNTKPKKLAQLRSQLVSSYNSCVSVSNSLRQAGL